MISLNLIADIFTASRLIISILIGVLGWYRGVDGWLFATILLVIAWSTDILDGIIARRSGSPGKTWVGKHDLHFDMLVALSLLVFMTSSSVINLATSLLYLFAWVLIFSRFGIRSALGKLFQAPIYAWFIVSSFLYQPPLGAILLIFLAFLMAVTWPRFPDDTIPSFISGFEQPKNSHNS